MGNMKRYYEQWHVTEEQWNEVEARLSPEEEGLHPCTHWDALECDCEGACSCHWKQGAPRLHQMASS